VQVVGSGGGETRGGGGEPVKVVVRVVDGLGGVGAGGVHYLGDIAVGVVGIGEVLDGA
jgi:hypothetical protein